MQPNMAKKIQQLLTVGCLLGIFTTGCGGGGGGGGEVDTGSGSTPTPPVTPTEPVTVADPVLAGPVSFTNVTVHDPSVIRLNDGSFYVFGSHLAAAKTTDLMHWTLVADGVNNANPLFATYESEVAEGIAWTGGYVGSWASDVIQLADGKFYFYYDHCASPENGNCDSSRSYLGLAVADSIEGPYKYVGLLLKSGQRGSENPGVDGNNYNGNIHPNAIDPDAFFDKDGKLWLVYGSYSGGIFILQLDAKTGLALPNQGYGTKLTGGYFSAIEGPYMLYHPATDYYYLFTSFGGFAQNDGYNMRIARSKSPTGPFVDANGRDMIGASGSWTSIEPFGVKLMGGHQWDANPGDPGTTHGYMAPGHNSAFYDSTSGNAYLIFHTRFPELGEGHQVRVHQLLTTSDGWLVAAPHRYVPLTGANTVDAGDLVGAYRVINHGKDINRTPHHSSYLQLTADGKVQGAYSGTYSLTATNQLTLTLGTAGTFKAALSWQYDDDRAALVPTFSGINSNGESLWGSQLPKASVADALTAIADALSLPARALYDVSLATVGTQGATISWSSSLPGVIATNGVLTRPLAGQAQANVVLTATISLKGQSLSKSFTVVVPPRAEYNRTAWYHFEDNLNDGLNIQAPATGTADRPNTTGVIGYSTGRVGQALQLSGSTGVRLPDGLIQSNQYTVSMWVQPSSLTQFSPMFFGAASTEQWLSLLPWSWDGNTMLWSGSQSWFDGSLQQQLPVGSWSHLAFSVNQGLVNVYLNGEQRFAGTGLVDLFSAQAAVFTLGVNYWDLPFAGLIDELAIYDVALSAAEIKALDIDRLSTSQLASQAATLLDLGDVSSVRNDLSLPTVASFGASVSWSSSHPAVVSNTGQVTRPAAGSADQAVVLTAVVTVNGVQASREFTVLVKAMGVATPIAAYSFDQQDLTDSQGQFAGGSVTGAKINSQGGSVSYATGVKGQALVLDGSSGVRLADNLLTDHSYTVSLWLNPQELTMFSTAFFGYASTESWVSLVPRGHAGVNENTMLWSGTAWYDAGIGQKIPTNQWSHLAFTNNGGKLVVYLNGTAVFSGSNFPNVFGSGASNGFALGVNYWDSPFKGSIDEVQIFAEALPAAEIQQLYLANQPK